VVPFAPEYRHTGLTGDQRLKSKKPIRAAVAALQTAAEGGAAAVAIMAPERLVNALAKPLMSFLAICCGSSL
jgi:hypothetical protein